MLRSIKDQLVGLDPKFEYRGLNQTRVETFSDVGFALAITLIVLSSSVPDSFEELRTSMRGILPFFLCVVLLVVIWVQHYMFFLKYGLQDIRTVVYNTFLLCLVLVYVYPLKFLMNLLVQFYISLILGEDFEMVQQMNGGDMKFLMITYGLGAGLIFWTIALLYRHAFNKRTELELNEYEIFQTKSSIGLNLLMGSIPMVSFLIAAIGPIHGLTFMLSGFIYMTYPIVMPLYGRRITRMEKKRFPD